MFVVVGVQMPRDNIPITLGKNVVLSEEHFDRIIWKGGKHCVLGLTYVWCIEFIQSDRALKKKNTLSRLYAIMGGWKEIRKRRTSIIALADTAIEQFPRVNIDWNM